MSQVRPEHSVLLVSFANSTDYNVYVAKHGKPRAVLIGHNTASVVFADFPAISSNGQVLAAEADVCISVGVPFPAEVTGFITLVKSTIGGADITSACKIKYGW